MLIPAAPEGLNPDHDFMVYLEFDHSHAISQSGWVSLIEFLARELSEFEHGENGEMTEFGRDIWVALCRELTNEKNWSKDEQGPLRFHSEWGDSGCFTIYRLWKGSFH